MPHLTKEDIRQRMNQVGAQRRAALASKPDPELPATNGRIVRGSRVRITVNGASYTGTVLSAINYGNADKPDWYIEFTEDHNGYAYWKQGCDGGTVEKVNEP